MGTIFDVLPGKLLQYGSPPSHDVALLNQYLSWYGYGPYPWLGGQYFTSRTVNALLQFQRNHRLAQTGMLDLRTWLLMALPRCGSHDPLSGYIPGASYVPSGYRWSDPNIPYMFHNSTGDMGWDAVQQYIRMAMDRWQYYAQVNLWQSGSAQMGFQFAVGDHGDGSPFISDYSAPIAHAFYPPPYGGSWAGKIHFNDFYAFVAEGAYFPYSVDLLTIALHEIGHALGLAHSSEPAAVMYAYYMGPRRELHPDDVAGIHSLYGVRNPYTAPTPPPSPEPPEPPPPPPPPPEQFNFNVRTSRWIIPMKAGYGNAMGVIVDHTAGPSQIVQLGVTQMLPGAQYYIFDPPSGYAPFSSTLWIQSYPWLQPGVYPVSITGYSGGLYRNDSFLVFVYNDETIQKIRDILDQIINQS